MSKHTIEIEIPGVPDDAKVVNARAFFAAVNGQAQAGHMKIDFEYTLPKPEPKYRDVTAADVGREIEVCDYAYIEKRRPVELLAVLPADFEHRFVTRIHGEGFHVWKHARIIDDGKPAVRAMTPFEASLQDEINALKRANEELRKAYRGQLHADGEPEPDNGDVPITMTTPSGAEIIRQVYKARKERDQAIERLKRAREQRDTFQRLAERLEKERDTAQCQLEAVAKDLQVAYDKMVPRGEYDTVRNDNANLRAENAKLRERISQLRGW